MQGCQTCLAFVLKSILAIKQNIAKLNNYCDTQGITLFECLKVKNISLEEFCLNIGLDMTLLNDIALKELTFLLQDPSTRIIYNPAMQDLSQDEIAIYSPNLKTNIGFLDKKVKITWDNTTSDDLYLYFASEFMGSRKKDANLETIHFSSDLTIDPIKANQRMLSLKYPIEHADLKISYIVSSPTGEILEEKHYQAIINHDLLFSDLQNIFRLLYNFNFSSSVAILKHYPTNFKIMSDEVEMNNFHNR